MSYKLITNEGTKEYEYFLTIKHQIMRKYKNLFVFSGCAQPKFPEGETVLEKLDENLLAELFEAMHEFTGYPSILIIDVDRSNEEQKLVWFIKFWNEDDLRGVVSEKETFKWRLVK